MTSKTINLDAIVASDIAHAASMDDLDDACRHLQDIAGITDGGVAAHCLGGETETWPNTPADERDLLLRLWLQTERNFI